ncbi:MAG: ABC transporter ATP-binding protein [Verrucomicrobiales bacterium]|nr:ABC transporter ATP-binding protein [Verrucomicrobiales bacterium]MED5586757.1 ABC transporter ATP-binding protein [Verrucomicrobiota bacterium]
MSEDSPSIIRVKNLTKSYGGFEALRGIDFEVQRGEVFGFLGPNGAGKTTAIRCMLDLIRPSSGSLLVAGHDPQRDPVAVRALCGYLPGELRLDENITVSNALSFFRQLRGGTTACHRRADVLSERLELDTTSKIKNLSKGNKQKIGIVSAFMHEPELLLLDEPTSGLDPLVQKTVMELVAEVQQEGATVFFSSHVLSEVQAVAGRVAIIRGGRIVEVSETSELSARGTVEVRVCFDGPVVFEKDQLAAFPGVKLITSDPAGRFMEFSVRGSMDGLVKCLAAYPVATLETRQCGLEEVFHAHYGKEQEKATNSPFQ